MGRERMAQASLNPVGKNISISRHDYYFRTASGPLFLSGLVGMRGGGAQNDVIYLRAVVSSELVDDSAISFLSCSDESPRYPSSRFAFASALDFVRRCIATSGGEAC